MGVGGTVPAPPGWLSKRAAPASAHHRTRPCPSCPQALRHATTPRFVFATQSDEEVGRERSSWTSSHLKGCT